MGRKVALATVITAAACSFAMGGKVQVPAASQVSAGEAGPTFVVDSTKIPADWTVIAYGGTLFTTPADTRGSDPKIRSWLVEKIAAEHPDALLIAGGLPLDGTHEGDYKTFREESESWQNEELRIFPALGDHEVGSNEPAGVANWWSTFPELKGHRWYSSAFRDAYIVVLDSNQPLTVDSPQRKWLEDQLDHVPRAVRFIFFVLNDPPVADIGIDSTLNPRANETTLGGYLEQKQKGSSAAFIVLAGYIHNYERFLINNVNYIVAGDGGATPTEVIRRPYDLFQDVVYPNYSYVKFTHSDGHLTGAMVRVADPGATKPEWETKDTFTIATPGSASSPPSAINPPTPPQQRGQEQVEKH